MKKNIKFLRTITIILLIFNGISALFPGLALIFDPTGKTIGLPLDLLKYSPFKNFFLPGIILFIMNGILSLFIAFWTIFHLKKYEYLIFLQGCILTGWIIIQIILIRSFHILHLIYGLIGLILIDMSIHIFKLFKEMNYTSAS